MPFYASLQEVTPPAQEPVTLSEVKDYLRIIHTENDASLQRLLEAARRAAELYLNQAFIIRRLEVTVGGDIPRKLRLPFAPVQSVVSVERKLDENADFTPVALDTMHVSADGDCVYSAGMAACQFRVRYDTGAFASSADVPEHIKQALLMHIEQLASTQGDAGVLDISAIYAPFRVVRV